MKILNSLKGMTMAIIATIVLVSCGQDASTKQNGFAVKGKVTNATEKTITLNELTAKGLILLDTATLGKDGSFEFKGKVKEKTFCIINFAKGAVLLVVDSASSIALSIDANTPDQFGVKGSDDTEQLRKLLEVNNTYMLQLRALETKYAQYTNEPPPPAVQEQIRQEYDSIMTGRKDAIQKFVFEGKPGIAAYFATNFLTAEVDFEFFDKVDKQFFPSYGNSKYALEHHNRVDVLRRTAIGQIAPDIVLSDPFGKTIPLSSLRGKYVLVDFWASWCRPCRMENPNVVRMYTKYKNKGFEVYSVSLDDNKDAWTKAINDDKLLWTHVSDLKKWNASVVPLYNIESIPFTVLLDKDGKIVAKNLRGAELEMKLAELMP
jgi:thiol-disulfide isomerase/thioredoxin